VSKWALRSPGYHDNDTTVEEVLEFIHCAEVLTKIAASISISHLVVTLGMQAVCWKILMLYMLHSLLDMFEFMFVPRN
jgi:hypothetical protein